MMTRLVVTAYTVLTQRAYPDGEPEHRDDRQRDEYQGHVVHRPVLTHHGKAAERPREAGNRREGRPSKGQRAVVKEQDHEKRKYRAREVEPGGTECLAEKGLVLGEVTGLEVLGPNRRGRSRGGGGGRSGHAVFLSSRSARNRHAGTRADGVPDEDRGEYRE